MNSRLLAALFATSLTAVALGPIACGSSGSMDFSVDGGDGGLAGNDASPADAFGNDGGWNGGGGAVGDAGGGVACRPLGQACALATDCCTLNCLKGSCQPPACTGDGNACASAGECCSGTCTGGICATLNVTCKTLGNGCQASTECCSKLCSGGICAQPSFCGQNGDICSVATDCCGGVCSKAAGAAFGTCAQPPAGGAQCSLVDGTLCAGNTLGDGGVVLTDGGIPACGGDCCSRSCAPWAPTGAFICQPASGCHPVGDVCRTDGDCCGGPGVPGPKPSSGKDVHCSIIAPNTVGVCENPQGCKPNGDVCRLQTNQCNATDECCSGNVQQNDTCKQDILGVPRCTNVACTAAGSGCATSADCCNALPCVPNPAGDPPFVCSSTQCVPSQGLCTTNADCCPGNICMIQTGSTTGTCASGMPSPSSDGGAGGAGDAGGSVGDAGACSLYGQTCAAPSDCCDGVPCTSGRCYFPVR